MENINMRMDNRVDVSEALYLISKFLLNCTPCAEAGKILENELSENALIGRIYSWTGSSRNATIEDLDRKYSNIPSDQLLFHLERSVGLTAQGNLSNSFSLLQPQHKQSASTSAESFRKRIAHLFNCIEEAREIEAKISKLTMKSVYIQNEISETPKGAIPSTIEPHHEVPLQDTIPQDNPPIPSPISINMTSALRHAAYSRERRDISNTLEELSSRKISLNTEIIKMKTSMRQDGVLLADCYRDCVETKTTFLRQRELGMTNLFGGLGIQQNRCMNGFRPSLSRMRNKLLYNYRILWSVSGHLHHPTYSVVFDHTGEYIISGADDFLVKIWNVEHGQLVRTCRGHQGYITIITISPDNAIIASACTKGTIRLWRFDDGLCLKVLQHRDSVNWLKFDLLSCSLASAGDDGYCIVWDLSVLLAADGSSLPLLDILEESRRKEYAKEAAAKRMKTRSSRVRFGMDVENDPHHASDGSGNRIFVNELDDQDGEGNENQESVRDDGIHRGPSFLWSSPSAAREGSLQGQLNLPHLRDSYTTNSAGDGATNQAIKVITLDISAAGGVVLTGCDDGVARLWRYSDSNGVGIATRAMKSQMLPELEELRGAVSAEEWCAMECVASHLICRLEGHVAPVTDTKFSECGDRVLTGSMNDGTVRVWSFGKDYTRHEHIVLAMHSDDNDADDNGRNHNFDRRRRGARLRDSKTLMYNACWTCDDQRIITLQNVVLPNSLSSIQGTAANSNTTGPTRLKVWDSTTGALLCVINEVSQRRCHVLVAHPIDPKICISAGCDGIINLWDISTVRAIASHQIRAPADVAGLVAGGPVEIVDASFSPDGLRLAVTDFIGRVTVLGPEDPSKYAEVLPEQYFSTDYSEVILDQDGFAMDAGTQLPVHISPVGPMIKVDGTPYPQKLLSLRCPSPLSRDAVQRAYNEVQEWARLHLNKLMEQNMKTFSRKKHRSFNNVSSPRNQSWDGSRNARPMVGANVHSIHDLISETHEENNANFDFLDDDSSDELADSDWDSPDAFRESRGQRLGSRLTRATRASNRGERLQTRSSRTGSGTSNTAASTTSTNTSNGTSAQALRELRAKRAEERARKRRAIHGEDDDDDRDSDSGEDNSSEEDQVGGSDNEESVPTVPRRNVLSAGANRKKRGRKPKKQPDDDDATGISTTLQQSPDIRKEKPWSNLHGIKTVPHGTNINRDWLTADETKENNFVPQVGDEVFYFPQGHMGYLSNYPENRSPPWLQFSSAWPVVECKVISVSYDFPNLLEYKRCRSVLVNVGLRLTGKPSKWGQHNNSSNNAHSILSDFSSTIQTRSGYEVTFEVTLRNSGEPDFLVPAYLYRRCTQTNWRPEIAFTMEYVDENDDGERVTKTYTGKVVTVSDKDHTFWPQSPWECLEVVWDDQILAGQSFDQVVCERVSPWEPVPLYGHTLPQSQHIRPPTIPEEIKCRVQEVIQTLLQQPEYELFATAVNEELFPDYYCFVAVPMSLQQIQNRLSKDYYRQVEGLDHDIRLIYTNCFTYNVEGSVIVMYAQVLMDRLLAAVSGIPYIDVTAEHNDGLDSKFADYGVIEEKSCEIDDSHLFQEEQDCMSGPGGDGTVDSSLVLRMSLRRPASSQQGHERDLDTMSSTGIDQNLNEANNILRYRKRGKESGDGYGEEHDDGVGDDDSASVEEDCGSDGSYGDHADDRMVIHIGSAKRSRSGRTIRVNKKFEENIVPVGRSQDNSQQSSRSRRGVTLTQSSSRLAGVCEVAHIESAVEADVVEVTTEVDNSGLRRSGRARTAKVLDDFETQDSTTRNSNRNVVSTISAPEAVVSRRRPSVKLESEPVEQSAVQEPIQVVHSSRSGRVCKPNKLFADSDIHPSKTSRPRRLSSNGASDEVNEQLLSDEAEELGNDPGLSAGTREPADEVGEVWRSGRARKPVPRYTDEGIPAVTSRRRRSGDSSDHGTESCASSRAQRASARPRIALDDSGSDSDNEVHEEEEKVEDDEDYHDPQFAEERGARATRSSLRLHRSLRSHSSRTTRTTWRSSAEGNSEGEEEYSEE